MQVFRNEQAYEISVITKTVDKMKNEDSLTKTISHIFENLDQGILLVGEQGLRFKNNTLNEIVGKMSIKEHEIQEVKFLRKVRQECDKEKEGSSISIVQREEFLSLQDLMQMNELEDRIFETKIKESKFKYV